MSDQTPREALRASTFFQGISDDDLDRLAEIAQIIDFPTDSEVFHEFDAARNVYVIVKGKVSLITLAPKSGGQQLMCVADGELIGWSPLLGREYLSDTACTLSPTTALVIDGEKLLAFCEEHPTFGYQFMHRVASVLAKRLSATRAQLREMSGFRQPKGPIESD